MGPRVPSSELVGFGSYPMGHLDLNRSTFWLSPQGGERFPVPHAVSVSGCYLGVHLSDTLIA